MAEKASLLAVRLAVFARDTFTPAQLRDFARAMGVPDQHCTDAGLVTRLPGWLLHLMAADQGVRQVVLAEASAPAAAGAPPLAAAPATAGLDVVASNLTAACAAAGPFEELAGCPEDVARTLIARLADAAVPNIGFLIMDPRAVVTVATTMEPRAAACALKITLTILAATPDDLADMDGAP